MAEKRYDSSNIKNLQFPENVRTKPTLYIGPIDGAGIFSILREVTDNCVDEALQGRCKICYVHVGRDNEYWVADDGAGIPVGKIEVEDPITHKKHKVPALKAAVGMLNTSGKFDDQAYAISRGCLVGETEVRLLNGKTVTLEKLYQRWTRNQTPIPILGFNGRTQTLVPTQISHAQITKRTRDLVVVRTDSGNVTCTPDHPFFVNRGGTVLKVKAERLQQGDSLVSVYYSQDKDGYDVVTEQGVKRKLHRLVASYFEDITPDLEEVHHKNSDKRNNTPSNLEIITKSDHQREHRDLRSRIGYDKIMERQSDLRLANSKTFSERNQDEDFIDDVWTSKCIKIAARALIQGLKPNKDSYDAVRRNSESGYKKACRYLGGRDELWAAARRRVAFLKSRVGYSLKAEEELESAAQSRGATPQEFAEAGSRKAMVKAWADKLLSMEDPEGCTPHEFNRKRGACVFGLYARMRRHTSLKKLKAHVLDGEPLVFFEDQSAEAQERRMMEAEIRLRAPSALQKQVSLFVRQFRAAGFDKRTYETQKSSNSPKWDWAMCILKQLHGVDEAEVVEFAHSYNHRVLGITHRKLTNAVPVYDITVDSTHNFFVAPGVLVSNTHGIGAKATNALSTEFEVWTHRSGEWYTTSYKKGVEKREVTKTKAPTNPVTGKRMTRGTLVRFKPDLSIFTESRFAMKLLVEWSTIAAFFTPAFRIVLSNDEGSKKEFHFPNGPIDYIKSRVEKLQAEPLSPKAFAASNAFVDCVVQFTNLSGTDFAGFTNGLRNAEGGVHVTAFYAALKASLDPYAKRGQSFTIHDLREGVIGIINAKLSHPQFDSQTKEKLVDDRASGKVEEFIGKQLKAFFAGNKALAAKICEQADKIRTLKNKFKLSKDAIRSIKKIAKTGFPVNSTVVPDIPSAKRTLFLVEGESAGGSARQARMPHDEILPLKGKILNVQRAQEAKVFASQEVLNILAMLGFDPDATDPMEKLRVGKIVLLADPDPDGPLHGNTEVLVRFNRNKDVYDAPERIAIEDLASRKEPFEVFAWDGTGGTWVKGEAPRVETVQDKWLHLEFDDGNEVACTVNHVWLLYSSEPDHRSKLRLNNGLQGIQARHLRVGDRLAAIASDDRSLREATITKIATIHGEDEPFYCMTVPGFHNFALSSGLLSKNCHINSLLLTLLATYLPGLFEKGVVFVAMTKPFYAFDEAKDLLITGDTALEVQEQLTKHGLTRLKPNHLKGWGECPPPLLQKLAFNPKTRILAAVKPWEGKKDKTEFELIMGDSPAARRKLLGIAQ